MSLRLIGLAYKGYHEGYPPETSKYTKIAREAQLFCPPFVVPSVQLPHALPLRIFPTNLELEP
jgi:hypothetical protein